MASSEDQEWSFLSDLQEADVVGTFDDFDSSLPDVEIHTCASDSLSNMDPAVASSPTVDAATMQTVKTQVPVSVYHTWV